MKTIICLCVLVSIAAVTLGHPFGDIMKQAQSMMGGGGGSPFSMIPGMGGGSNPFTQMMQQAQQMMGQSGGGPEQIMKMFQENMAKFPEKGQEMMGQFMEKMTSLKDEGAPQEKFMDLFKEMQKQMGQ